jgi:hypothetical protein
MMERRRCGHSRRFAVNSLVIGERQIRPTKPSAAGSALAASRRPSSGKADQ